MGEENCQKVCQYIYNFRTFKPAGDFNREGINCQQETSIVVNEKKNIYSDAPKVSRFLNAK